MAWKATVEDPITVVLEGEYDATPIDVRLVAGPHGELVKIDFMLAGDHEFEGRQVSGVANKRLSENTKLGRWVSAIMGRMPVVGEEIMANDLLHKECRVIVKHKPNSDGTIFANVVQVLPRRSHGLDESGERA